MRNTLIILGICALFLTLSFSGCEDFGTKPDHLTVNVMVAVYVHFIDTNNNVLQKSTDGMSVTIKIIKNGQDQLAYDRFVQNGLCQATGSLELSEGQYIECFATIESKYQDFTPVAPGYALLTWETALEEANIADMYHWYPEMTLNMKMNSTL